MQTLSTTYLLFDRKGRNSVGIIQASVGQIGHIAVYIAEFAKKDLSAAQVSAYQKPRRVSRPMGAKGTGIIFGGGVYVAENTSGSR